jgi:hypothetical protein
MNWQFFRRLAWLLFALAVLPTRRALLATGERLARVPPLPAFASWMREWSQTTRRIVLAASLSEGLGSPEFQQVMAENPDLKKFKQRILGTDYFVMDQWQLEELAKVVNHCKVKVVTDGIPAETLRQCFVEPATSVLVPVAFTMTTHDLTARLPKYDHMFHCSTRYEADKYLIGKRYLALRSGPDNGRLDTTCASTALLPLQSFSSPPKTHCR